ncbi:MAG: 2-amino-4-hydroxy-6-hydroxymethyldihydropteridine diphosphokinase [Xanthomonadaceae bacterium]|nr:2-amino-4-hydroxy-6-hydroxymethyldihydropteridine diphosphokinase [Xanthomonadaceae bacterium]
MDTVFIEGLEIEAVIGIYDWERRVRQPLQFDVEMAFDNRKAATTDAIADTLDYKAVSKRLIAFVGQSTFALVETLAEHCASLILLEFPVSQVRLKLSKPGAVRGARAVGVSIQRSRDTPAPAPAVDIATAEAATRAPATRPARPAAKKKPAAKFQTATCKAYLSLGSNLDPENNLRRAVAALRARFGEVVVSPVYRTAAEGFSGPDFLNAIAIIDSDIHPFALNDWLHALEIVQGRDRRDEYYSNRPLDIDIIYFGNLVLEGPGEFQLPRPELHHAYVLKPLSDVAPDFVDPLRKMTLAKLWKAHPRSATPPAQVAIDFTP